MTQPHILVVDDDPQIREILSIAVEAAGYEVSNAADGQDALDTFAAIAADLVILDIGLPEMDGREVCRQLRRASDVPVVFLTAQDDEIDRVVGLELGADDYVTKPFSPRELVARIRAILKRTGSAPRSDAGGEARKRGILTLDPGRHDCRVAGAPVSLTAREMELLAQLMERPEHVIPRPRLVDQVYGTNVHVSDRTMDSHLRNLRAKLGRAGCPDAIETVHGVGIRMGACRGA